MQTTHGASPRSSHLSADRCRVAMQAPGVSCWPLIRGSHRAAVTVARGAQCGQRRTERRSERRSAESPLRGSDSACIDDCMSWKSETENSSMRRWIIGGNRLRPICVHSSLCTPASSLCVVHTTIDVPARSESGACGTVALLCSTVHTRQCQKRRLTCDCQFCSLHSAAPSILTRHPHDAPHPALARRCISLGHTQSRFHPLS